MKYFTCWFNPPIREDYKNCLEKTLKVIPDLEIWETFPKNYPFKIKEKEIEFHVTDKFRVWMLGYYYEEGAIWIDCDVIVRHRYEIPKGKIMISRPYNEVGWLDILGPGFLCRDDFLRMFQFPFGGWSVKGVDPFFLLENLKNEISSQPIDLWAVGHNGRPEFFREIVDWLLDGNEDKIFGIHKFVADKMHETEFFPLGLFRHCYFSAFPRYMYYKDDFGKSSVEIDITYKCDKRCKYCNRFCDLFPTDESMSVSQIEKFIADVHSSGKKFDIVRVLGGEPMLHNNIEIILKLLREEFSDSVIILCTAKELSEEFKKFLENHRIVVEYGLKSIEIISKYAPMYVAARDIEELKYMDYENGWKECFIATHCGIGVTPYGYYPCAVAGAIDRIFGYGLGKKKFENFDWSEVCSQLCSLCGHVFGLHFPRFPSILKMLEKFYDKKSDYFITPSWYERLEKRR